MIIKRIKINKESEGFTLVETLVYLFIMTMLLMLISSLVLSIINTRKQLKVSHLVHNNARFIVNFLNNRIHNIDIIDNVSPELEEFHFYELPDTRFSLDLEGDNLVYRETADSGSGFPDQSTADAVILNNSDVVVSNFDLTGVDDSEGNENKGVVINFTLTVGQVGDTFGYMQKDFNTFISIR